MLRVGIEYNVQLQKLVKQVYQSVTEALLPVIEQEKPNYIKDEWPQRIQEILTTLTATWSGRRMEFLADRLANNFVRTTVSFVDRTNNRRFGIDVLQSSPELTNYVSAATIQNANLIKSIPAQFLENVSNTVMSNMRVGLLPNEIAKQLQEQYGVTQRRARFIARDQTAKVNGEVSKQRQIDSGFEYFQWIDSDDQRVRHSHEDIAEAMTPYGKGIYKWSDLPTNDRGEKIQPGSDYGCRCTAKPVRNSVVEKNIADGKVKK